MLKIAILGTRGIPNHYGGFEQFAGYLSKGLVNKGHSVTVYNSHNHPYQNNEWNGVKIIHCYDPEYLIGTAGQFIYDLNCILDTRRKQYDIILMLGYTSSSVWRNLYPSKSILITNMDGLEWKRARYNTAVKRFLLWAEKLAVRKDGFLVADSPSIKTYLDAKYQVNSKYIPYGAEVMKGTEPEVLHELGLSEKEYYILVARAEPENNIELILDGFVQSDTGRKFVVVGNTSNKFGKYLLSKYKHFKNICFTGSIYNREKVNTLAHGSLLYFHGHSVGGTNPSLLEAMAAGALIAAHDNPFNRTILGENACYFSTAAGARNLMKTIKRGNTEAQMIERNLHKIQHTFTWDKIIDEYEQYFFECYALKNKGAHIITTGYLAG